VRTLEAMSTVCIGAISKLTVLVFLSLFFKVFSSVCLLSFAHPFRVVLDHNKNKKREKPDIRFLWRWRKEENKILIFSVDYALICNGLSRRDKLTK